MHGAHADDAVGQRRPERVRELHGELPLGARHGAPPGHVPPVAPDGRRDVGVAGRERRRRRRLQVLVDAPRLHRAPRRLRAGILGLGPPAAALRRRGVVLRWRWRWRGDHHAQRQLVGVLDLRLDRATSCKPRNTVEM